MGYGHRLHELAIAQANVALAFLTKPFSDEALIAAVAIVMALKEGKEPLPATPAGLRIFKSRVPSMLLHFDSMDEKPRHPGEARAKLRFLCLTP